MTNREKLFEILNKMSNKKLSFIVNFPRCEECPCCDFCKNSERISCNILFEEWLDSDDE